MCLPSFDLIVRHLKRVIRNGNDIKSVFVASDNNYMIEELTKALARMEVRNSNIYTIHIHLYIYNINTFNIYYRFQFLNKIHLHRLI